MDITYQLQGVEFEWDEEKARSNIANHGMTFEEAAEVFFDPFYQGGAASTEDSPRVHHRLFPGPTAVVGRLC